MEELKEFILSSKFTKLIINANINLPSKYIYFKLFDDEISFFHHHELIEVVETLYAYDIPLLLRSMDKDSIHLIAFDGTDIKKFSCKIFENNHHDFYFHYKNIVNEIPKSEINSFNLLIKV